VTSSRWAPLAAVAVLVAGPSSSDFATTHGPKTIVLHLLAAALCWHGGVRRWGPPEGLLLAALCSALISAVWGSSGPAALAPLFTLGAAGAFALGVSGVEDRERWLRWLGYAAVALALIALVEIMGLIDLVPRGRAPASLMGQRNTLAHVLVLISPAVWWLALERRRWLMAAGLLAAVVLATRSRAGWVVGAGVLPLFVALVKTRASLRVAAAVGVGVVVAGLAPTALLWSRGRPYLDTLGRLLDTSRGSGAGRLREWSESAALALVRPVFGSGPGAWFAEYGVRHDGDHFAHSDLVGVLVERGGLGLVLWVALGVGLVVWRKAPEVRCTVIAAGALGALDAVLQLPAALVVVVVVAFAGARRDLPSASQHSLRWLSVPLVLGAIVATLAWSSRLLSTSAGVTPARLEQAALLDPFDGELRVQLAEVWISAGDCSRAAVHLERARALLPRHPRLGELQAACP
jgi:hypothetical protein